MGEFENLVARLLTSSPGLSRQDIDERIRVKKEKIGAGYLTDQGALFLVASDLGVQLSEPLKTQTGLGEIYPGARDVELEVRVMGISAPRQYSRKDGGSQFTLRTMTIYDQDATCSAKMWDASSSLPVLDTLQPGDPIKITGAYIKSDINGAKTVNLGEGSGIELLDDLPDIPGIDQMAKDAGDLSEADRDVVVSGILDGMVGTMNFTNSRGGPGKALRMRIRGSDGASYRVVLWGQDDSGIPRIVPPQSTVLLLGVRAKQTNRGLEIHGSESTIVRIDGKDSAEPLSLRILSISEGDRGGRMVLSVDSQKSLYFVMDAANHSKECVAGDVIECMPTKAYGKSITLDEDAYIVRKTEGNPDIPELGQMRTKLSETRPDGDYCVEVVALKDPEIRDIQTKSGESVQLLEMFVGDDTDERWIKGWRNQARLASGCKAGDRLSVTGLSGRQGMEGRTDLTLTAYSAITSITDPKTP